MLKNMGLVEEYTFLINRNNDFVTYRCVVKGNKIYDDSQNMIESYDTYIIEGKNEQL